MRIRNLIAARFLAWAAVPAPNARPQPTGLTEILETRLVHLDVAVERIPSR